MNLNDAAAFNPCASTRPVLLLKLVGSSEQRLIVNSRLEVHYREPGRGAASAQTPWRVIVASGRYENTNAFFNECQRLTVDGQPLPRFISIDGTAYWEFLPSYIWPEFFVATQLVELLTSLFEQLSPSAIVLIPAEPGLDRIWRGVARAVAARSGIAATVMVGASDVQRLQRYRLGAIEFLRRKGVAYLVRCVKRNRASHGGAIERSAPGERGKVLFVTHGGRHWVNKPGTDGERHDEQFYPFLADFERAGWRDITLIDVEDLPQAELDLRNRDHPGRLRWRRLSSYASTNLLRSLGQLCRARQLWRRLQRDEQFTETFCYMGVALVPALGHVLERAVNDLVPECSDLVEIAARALEQEHPAAVLLTYETGPWQRAFIIRASRSRIPTIGLQHGMIFPNHYDYTHEGKTNDPSVRPAFFSVPRVTCVWGDAWRQTLLTHGHYPQGSVEVTGHWRYDFLGARAANDSAAVAAPAVVVICLAGDNVAATFRACWSALHEVSGISIRIRLHPAEDERPIKQLLAEYAQPDTLIHRGNLFDLLDSCEIVVSQYSTLISEAALADKPIVLIDFDRKFFTSAYEDAGICVAAREPQELRTAITRILTEPPLRAQLARAREVFMSRYFYKLDGAAARRVVGLVERLCGSIA